MAEADLPAYGQRSFEELKKVNQYGAEYWSARELQPLLGYSQWRRFEDAGYKGLYGMGSEQIKKHKGIAGRENLMDRMNTTELAANQFRMTQTRDKLARGNVRGREKAIETHKKVGQEVRDAIRRIGGTLPENIPAAEPLSQVKKRLKTEKPKLQLEDRDKKGLAGYEGKSDE